MFDYLYVKDLARITSWFIENDARHKAYNVCTGRPVALTELAGMVAEVSGCNPSVSVIRGGMGSDYTGDNSRLLGEMGEYQFQDVRGSVAELYAWYAANSDQIDETALQFDSRE